MSKPSYVSPCDICSLVLNSEQANGGNRISAGEAPAAVEICAASGVAPARRRGLRLIGVRDEMPVGGGVARAV